MLSTARKISIIVGAAVLLSGLAIIGLSLRCGAGPGCLATFNFVGLPAVGWGVILLFFGLTLIAGFGWASAPV